MSELDLAGMIDHTLLAPNATAADIRRLCCEAADYGFKSVCVNPIWVGLASRLLQGKTPLVCSVVGFPLGASVTKAAEAARAVADGADELDMVLPVGHLLEGSHDVVRDHIREVVEAASGRPVKVILETCLLGRREKLAGCRLALEAGAGWVKTSTGFSSGGATVEDVRLMAGAVNGEAGVKASGGIGTRDQALRMVAAGAGRLGCSRSIDVVGRSG
jgi:deoxyribose-phosphate aldolase